MTPNGHEESMRWLQEAAADLEAIACLIKGGHYHLACFHAQQAAEKAVKAFLYAQKVEEPWGHSVANLIKDASTYHAPFSDLVKAGVALDRYYIPTRYPNGLPGGLPSQSFFETDARSAMSLANTIVASMRQHVAP